jgi:predicted DNA-binding antitoxin AbrB/MazE fold protein
MLSMTITIEAIYEDGVLKPAEPLPLAEHKKVQVTIHAPVDVQTALEAVERSYGLLKWTGDRETLDRIAMDPEFGIEEAR